MFVKTWSRILFSLVGHDTCWWNLGRTDLRLEWLKSPTTVRSALNHQIFQISRAVTLSYYSACAPCVVYIRTYQHLCSYCSCLSFCQPSNLIALSKINLFATFLWKPWRDPELIRMCNMIWSRSSSSLISSDRLLGKESWCRFIVILPRQPTHCPHLCRGCIPLQRLVCCAVMFAGSSKFKIFFCKVNPVLKVLVGCMRYSHCSSVKKNCKH